MLSRYVGVIYIDCAWGAERRQGKSSTPWNACLLTRCNCVTHDAVLASPLVPDRGQLREGTMVQKVQVILLDDVDGSEADETVTFGLDGVEYEIDLTGERAEELRKAMETWTNHGRRVGRGGRVQVTNARRPRATNDVDINAVRTWAREHGYQVSDRGRVSGDVLEAYKNRHKIVIPEAAPAEAVVTEVEGEPQDAKPTPKGRARKSTAAKVSA